MPTPMEHSGDMNKRQHALVAQLNELLDKYGVERSVFTCADPDSDCNLYHLRGPLIWRIGLARTLAIDLEREWDEVKRDEEEDT